MTIGRSIRQERHAEKEKRMTTDSKTGAVVASEESTCSDEDDEHSSSDLSLSPHEEESDDELFSSDDEAAPLTLKELKREFHTRDKLLNQLLKGVDPTYARMMRENERAVRAQKMLRLQKSDIQKQQQDLKVSKTTKISSSSNVEKSEQEEAAANVDGVNGNKIGVMERLHRMIAFDIQNMLPGMLVIILNCIAYTGFNQIVTTFVVRWSGMELEYQRFLPATMILLGAIILRVTGGMCDWVNAVTYARIKFDMKNRLCLGRWDAIVMKWFLDHEFLATYLNVLAFFAVNHAVYAYQEQALIWAFDIRPQLFQDLPSVKQGVMTAVGKKLSAGLGEEHVQRVLRDATCTAGTCSLENIHDDLAHQDKAYLASSMAADCYVDFMGNETAGLCTETALFWFYVVFTIAALIALKMMGHKFWSI